MGQFFVSAKFDCLEEFAYANRNIWDLDVRQLSIMDSPVYDVQFSLADMSISAFGCNCIADQGGEPPEGMYTFIYVPPNSTPYVWKGVDVDPGSLIFIGKHSEISAISRQSFDSLTFSLPIGVVEAALEQESFLDLDRNPLKDDRVFKLGDLHMDQLEAIYVLAENIVRHEKSPVEEKLLQDMFLMLVIKILRFSLTGSRLFAPRTRQVLYDVLSHCRKSADKNLSVAQLSRDFGITERRLQGLFKSELGDMTPKSYLMSQRLYLAYRKLRVMDPVIGGVTQVAADLEFKNFSKFSTAYRRTLGELPSETLNRPSIVQ